MRGFTLLELMVVIVILCGLTALILPMLASNRGNSRRSGCANNLSQLGKALIMYSDVPENVTFPSDQKTTRGDPMRSLGMLYREYVSDYRVFSCSSKPTISQLAAIRPNINGVPSEWPLNASMTHFGYDPGNKGTGYQPHSPNDAIAIVVADFTMAGRNSDNHGPAAGQNCLRASGSVEWFDNLVNVVATGSPVVQDTDITADGNITDTNWVNMESFISQ